MNKPKIRGTRWETEVVTWLRSVGFKYAERRALTGALDKGDCSGIPGVVLEMKAVKNFALAEMVDEAEREAKNAGVDVFFVVLKRPRKNVSKAYWITTGEVAAELIR